MSLDISHAKPLLDSAKSVTILLAKNPSYDAVAAGLACKLALDASGKVTNIVCETPMTVEYNRLIGVETIDTSLGSRNLVISFHDQTDLVDKVSYNIDEGELRLLITPKSGVADLDHRRLKFTPGRSASDLLIIVDADRLEHLGSIYETAKDMITSAKIISINRRPPSDNFTQTQIYDPQSSSLSELMVKCIDSLNLKLQPDMATNLLAGLQTHTKNFQTDDVSPETFEVASRLLKHGASRHRPVSASEFPAGSIPANSNVAGQFIAPPPPVEPTPVPTTQSGYGNDSQQAPSDAPSDWYEPKIYHGPMLQ